MSPRLGAAVELLDRSLAFTCVALADVSPAALDRPTPCRGWSLAALLAHMDDSLDAFLEAADGVVAVTPPAAAPDPVGRLRGKAGALLGAWTAAEQQARLGRRTGEVRVGDGTLDADLLVRAAALEIAVHGWDVAAALGAARRLPAGLAVGLLDVAAVLVDDRDRGVRFAPPRPVAPGTPADLRLLELLGRATAAWV